MTPQVIILLLMSQEIRKYVKGQGEMFRSVLVKRMSSLREDTNRQMRSTWDSERTVRGKKKIQETG